MKRFIHSSRTLLVKAPFEASHTSRPASAYKNIPVDRPVKAWERDNEDKDSWFRRKYAHVHVKQKANREAKQKERDLRNPPKPRAEKPINPFKSLAEDPVHQYLFGTAPVMAALKAGKRDFYGRLYVHNPKEKHDEIVDLLQKRGGTHATASSKNDLNLLTKNNVHNGYVLQTTSLPVKTVKSLSKVENTEGNYGIMVNELGREYESRHKVVRSSNGTNYPVGVYLDEITDPHNVGAIIRSAYYLGLDFVVMTSKNCAPLSPVVCKSSAGAMEFIPIYSVQKPSDFLMKCSQNGWNVVSAVASTSPQSDKLMSSSDLPNLLQSGPSLLVLGSEGAGLRTNILQRSDFYVRLEGRRDHIDPLIDSLNVSVAAALLMQGFFH